jgi:hypothetical protein
MQDRINKMITMQRLQSDVARERMTASALANVAADVSEAGGVNNDSVNGNKVAAAKSADSSSSSSSSSLRIVLPSPRWTIRREDTDVTKDITSQRVVTTRDDSSFWTAAGSQQSMMTTIASNNMDHHHHHNNNKHNSGSGLFLTAATNINGHETKENEKREQPTTVVGIGGVIGNISKPRMKPRSDTTAFQQQQQHHHHQHGYYGGMDNNNNDTTNNRKNDNNNRYYDDSITATNSVKVREGEEEETNTNTTTNQEYEVRIRQHRRQVLYTILCHPFHRLYDNLRSMWYCCCCNLSSSSSSSSMIMSILLSRAICCGAIDGLLTGLGILMACLGLGLSSLTLCSTTTTTTTIGASEERVSDGFSSSSSSSSSSSRYYTTKEDDDDDDNVHDAIIIIALTLAATSSDAICMAIGHVWSSILVTNMTHYERCIGIQSFHTNRAQVVLNIVCCQVLRAFNMILPRYIRIKARRRG